MPLLGQDMNLLYNVPQCVNTCHAGELTLTLLVLSRVQKCPEKMGGNLDGQIPDRDVGSGVRGAPDFGLPYYPPP